MIERPRNRGMQKMDFRPSDSEYEEPLTDKLRNRETLTFVNSVHRNEQHKNENLQRNDESTKNSVDYYEDNSIHQVTSHNEVNFGHQAVEVPKQQYDQHNTMYVTDIENGLTSNQQLYGVLLESYRLQEQIDDCNYNISYYSSLKEYCTLALSQYYGYCSYYSSNYSSNNCVNTGYDKSSAASSQHVAFTQEPVAPTVHIPQGDIEKRLTPKPCHSNSKSYKNWEGVLPKRKRIPGEEHSLPEYSKKVFVGGVPWDITEDQLCTAFSRFGSFSVQWPTRDSNSAANVRIKGYLYLIFDHADSVRSLIDQIKDSGVESNGGSITFNFRIKCNRNKHVQIVPWLLSDNFWEEPYHGRNELKTIFVGGLHGKLYAQAMFAIFNELFKNVVSVKIDTDEYNYPTGSGSIAFSSTDSYIKALHANYIEVKTSTFGPKSIEIQHFMEDKPCSLCDNAPGRKFCKSECFQYFCDLCWKRYHQSGSQHVAVTRHHRNKEGDYHH